jgi:hypothetical protein
MMSGAECVVRRIVVGSILGAAACGSGGGSVAPPSTDSPIGGIIDGGDGGKGGPIDGRDGSVGSPAFVSNTPGATVVDASDPANPNLVLLSSNLLQLVGDAQVAQQWGGEVQNIGSDTVCTPIIDVRFKDAAGAELAAFTANGNADPYVPSLSTLLTVACMPPGGIASFVGHRLAPSAVALGQVASIAVKLTTRPAMGSVPQPDLPVVTSSVSVTDGGFGYAIGGSVTAGAAAIQNIIVNFYPRDASGLVLGHVVASRSTTLAAQQAFSFTTASVPFAFTDYRVYPDFLE